MNDSGDGLAYPGGGQWLPLDATNTQQKPLKAKNIGHPIHYPTKKTEIYTPWAVLTTPAAAISAVAIDIPMTVGLLMAVGVTELIPSQQQFTGPENHSTREGQKHRN